MFKDKFTICAGSMVAVTLVAGAFLSSFNVSADDTAIDNVAVTVPVSCSMEGTGMNSHNASIVNGTYQADIGSTTLKAFCNDANGFAIYAIGFTDDEYGKTVLTNSTLGSTADIETGTATSGSTSNWAMKLATNTSATYALTLDNGFGSYSSVPATYTKVAHRDSGTDTGTSATGSELTSTYAAYMNQTQPAGTYTGQVKYTLVHPSSETPAQPMDCETGKICYYPNSGLVVGQMGKQTPTSTEVTLWASNYKRAGYGFAGWNDKFDYSGNFYGPNETITAPSDVQTNGLSLYAVWIKSAGSLQNWNGCSSLASGATTALTDERDNNTYAVAKLADGKCWMIENLRLDDSAELSSTNSHNPSLPITNVYDATNPTTSNHLSPTTNPTTTAWCQDANSACIDQSMLATNNTTLFTGNTASGYSASSNVYSYGNYYNWYSATVGNGKYGSSYSNGYHSPGDICPAGWRLPKGANKTNETNNEFWSLIVTGLNGGVNPANYDSSTYPYYDGTEATPVSNALRSYPNNFVYSGGVNGSSVTNRNAYGRYWSASGYYSSSVYDMSFYSTNVIPGTGNISKYYGRMVRCVAGV